MACTQPRLAIVLALLCNGVLTSATRTSLQGILAHEKKHSTSGSWESITDMLTTGRGNNVLTMPRWSKSYQDGNEVFLDVFAGHNKVMEVSNKQHKFGWFGTWGWDKVKDHVTKVRDASGSLVALITPSMEGARNAYCIFEVIHSTTPMFAGQKQSMEYEGTPLYVRARSQVQSGNGMFSIFGKYHDLCFPTRANDGSAVFDNAQKPVHPQFTFEVFTGDWSQSFSKGFMTVSGDTNKIGIVKASEEKKDYSEYSFQAGVDPVLQLLFHVAVMKYKVDMDPNQP